MLGFARILVVVVGVLLIALGFWLASYGNEGDSGLVVVGLVTALIGVAGIVVLAFERMRYRRDASAADAPATGWRRTDEVFMDPTTGVRTRVWVDPGTGQRDYRPEG